MSAEDPYRVLSESAAGCRSPLRGFPSQHKMHDMRPRTPRRPRGAETVNRGEELSAANVRFEVFHNGRRLARAGIPGFAVLTAALTWVRRNPDRRHYAAKGVEPHELYLHVGGLDSNDPERERHVRWALPLIRLGDRVEVRIGDDSRVDPPAAEYASQIKKRPEPPPEGDPTRVSVKDAVVWPAPAGVYLKALNWDDGGPVTLTRREATALARALERVATKSEGRTGGKRRSPQKTTRTGRRSR